MNNYRKVFITMILFSMFAAAGCQATTSTFIGATAHEDTVIALPAQSAASQQWQDFYITVDYSLNRQADKLGIEGSFVFTEYVRANLRRVRDLKLWLYLLDANNRVVSSAMVGRTVSTDVDASVKVQGELPLGAEVTAIAFGYRGGLVGDRRSPEFIWKLPQSNE